MRASAPSAMSPACRARPFRASTSGAPIRKIRKGGTAVPVTRDAGTSSAVWVTPAAICADNAKGPPGIQVQRPRINAPAAVTSRGTRRVQRTAGTSPSRGLKNARMIMGRKYARFRTLDATRMSRIHQSPVVPAPTERYHLAIKPAIGGSPAMLNVARVNAPNSQGIFLPRPFRLGDLCLSGLHRYCTGDKEHGQLAKCMGGKCKCCTDNSRRPSCIRNTGYPGWQEYRCAKDHVAAAG